MIITLAGKVTAKGESWVVVETAGVGYEVRVAAAPLARLRTDEDVRLWTHEHTRDDGRELYGFLSQSEHRLFRKLIAVSGVGPKTALAMFGLGAARDIELMIEKGDVARLSSVSGIGKKTAQKIVLELKGRLVSDESGESDDVVTALVGLGYSREKAREALSRVGAAEDSDEKKLRAALRELGR